MNKKCKQMMGAVLLMASFSQSGSALATSCAVPPTCEQLGYKMKVDDCGENPVLRCPFALSDDNQVYCTESAQNQVVSVGAILYGDGTVASGLVTGKTPIGIVFDTANRLAVALTDINSSGSAGSTTMYWSSSYCDTPNLDNCTSSDGLTSCGVDGRMRYWRVRVTVQPMRRMAQMPMSRVGAARTSVRKRSGFCRV